MKDKNKTKKQLMEEVAKLRHRLTELEKSREPKQIGSQNKPLKKSFPYGIDVGILEQAISSSISGVGITDIEGKLIYVNGKIVEMWGYEDKNEVLGRYLEEFWEGDGIHEAIKVLRKKGAIIGEDIGKKKDGSRFFVDYMVSIIQDRSNRPKYMFGSFVDNTSRKKIEEDLKKVREELELKVKERTAELRKAMEKLRSILDSSPDSITVTDENGVIVDCNRATLKNLGYSKKKELVGRSPLDIIAGKDHERAMNNLRIATEQGAVHNIEYEIVRKDGHVYPASLSAAAIKDASGKIRGFVAITKNITQRKQAEDALRKSEAKLREQKEALEQKNIALREIIAQIEIEKRRIKDDIAVNASTVLLPILDTFKVDEMTQKYIDLVKHHIQKMTSAYGSKINDVETKLTSREMEICSMVKGGLSNKDISRLLNISDQTVEGHRKKIRKKLGLRNKPVNLTAYLRGL